MYLTVGFLCDRMHYLHTILLRIWIPRLNTCWVFLVRYLTLGLWLTKGQETCFILLNDIIQRLNCKRHQADNRSAPYFSKYWPFAE